MLSWNKNGFEFRAVSDLNTNEFGHFERLVMPSESAIFRLR